MTLYCIILYNVPLYYFSSLNQVNSRRRKSPLEETKVAETRVPYSGGDELPNSHRLKLEVSLIKLDKKKYVGVFFFFFFHDN